jgi:hypothetical protein
MLHGKVPDAIILLTAVEATSPQRTSMAEMRREQYSLEGLAASLPCIILIVAEPSPHHSERRLLFPLAFPSSETGLVLVSGVGERDRLAGAWLQRLINSSRVTRRVTRSPETSAIWSGVT